MYCRKCGAYIYDGEDKCPVCGEKVPKTLNCTETTNNLIGKSIINDHDNKIVSKVKSFGNNIRDNRMRSIIIAVIIVVLIAIPVIMKMNCNCVGCSNIVSRGNYCSEHVCFSDGCKEKRESGSYFCWLHNEMIEYQNVANLDISNVYVTTNSVSTIAKGTITNNGYSTYKFIQVKGSFTDSSGQVIDTGSTYAVGSEGLESGQSAEFCIYIDKNYYVKDCNVSVYDYSE